MHTAQDGSGIAQSELSKFFGYFLFFNTLSGCISTGCKYILFYVYWHHSCFSTHFKDLLICPSRVLAERKNLQTGPQVVKSSEAWSTVFAWVCTHSHKWPVETARCFFTHTGRKNARDMSFGKKMRWFNRDDSHGHEKIVEQSTSGCRNNQFEWVT